MQKEIMSLFKEQPLIPEYELCLNQENVSGLSEFFTFPEMEQLRNCKSVKEGIKYQDKKTYLSSLEQETKIRFKKTHRYSLLSVAFQWKEKQDLLLNPTYLFSFCQTLLETLENIFLAEEFHQARLGIFGNWGIGKTSLLRTLQLEAIQQNIPIRFLFIDVTDYQPKELEWWFGEIWLLEQIRNSLSRSWLTYFSENYLSLGKKIWWFQPGKTKSASRHLYKKIYFEDWQETLSGWLGKHGDIWKDLSKIRLNPKKRRKDLVKTVIVFDNLDRCNFDQQNALLRALCKHQDEIRTPIIVCMDDRLFLQNAQKKGISDEILQKACPIFFQMTPPRREDLLDFSGKLLKKIPIPLFNKDFSQKLVEDIIQVISGGPNITIRYLKVLLNEFHLEILRRDWKGKEKDFLSQNLPALMLLVMIRHHWSELYRYLLERPAFLPQWLLGGFNLDHQSVPAIIKKHLESHSQALVWFFQKNYGILPGISWVELLLGENKENVFWEKVWERIEFSSSFPDILKSLYEMAKDSIPSLKDKSSEEVLAMKEEDLEIIFKQNFFQNGIFLQKLDSRLQWLLQHQRESLLQNQLSFWPRWLFDSTPNKYFPKVLNNLFKSIDSNWVLRAIRQYANPRLIAKIFYNGKENSLLSRLILQSVNKSEVNWNFVRQCFLVPTSKENFQAFFPSLVTKNALEDLDINSELLDQVKEWIIGFELKPVFAPVFPSDIQDKIKNKTEESLNLIILFLKRIDWKKEKIQQSEEITLLFSFFLKILKKVEISDLSRLGDNLDTFRNYAGIFPGSFNSDWKTKYNIKNWLYFYRDILEVTLRLKTVFPESIIQIADQILEKLFKESQDTRKGDIFYKDLNQDIEYIEPFLYLGSLLCELELNSQNEEYERYPYLQSLTLGKKCFFFYQKWVEKTPDFLTRESKNLEVVYSSHIFPFWDKIPDHNFSLCSFFGKEEYKVKISNGLIGLVFQLLTLQEREENKRSEESEKNKESEEKRKVKDLINNLILRFFTLLEKWMIFDQLASDNRQSILLLFSHSLNNQDKKQFDSFFPRIFSFFSQSIRPSFWKQVIQELLEKQFLDKLEISFSLMKKGKLGSDYLSMLGLLYQSCQKYQDKTHLKSFCEEVFVYYEEQIKEDTPFLSHDPILSDEELDKLLEKEITEEDLYEWLDQQKVWISQEIKENKEDTAFNPAELSQKVLSILAPLQTRNPDLYQEFCNITDSWIRKELYG